MATAVKWQGTPVKHLDCQLCSQMISSESVTVFYDVHVPAYDTWCITCHPCFKSYGCKLVLALVRSMTLKRWRKLMDDEDRFLLLGFVEKDCEKLGLTYDQAITAWNLGKDLVLANKEKEDDA